MKDHFNQQSESNQIFPITPRPVGPTRLDRRYQKIQCEPRNLFAPRVIVVLDLSDVESNIFNGTILYTFYKDPRVTRNVKRRRARRA